MIRNKVLVRAPKVMRKFSTTLRFNIPEEAGYSENFIYRKKHPSFLTLLNNDDHLENRVWCAFSIHVEAMQAMEARISSAERCKVVRCIIPLRLDYKVESGVKLTRVIKYDKSKTRDFLTKEPITIILTFGGC